MWIRGFSGSMATIGQQLQHARLALELSVEDVTFQTRIPAGLVRAMEKDDLSHFANLTYARGFLKLYSQFLGLDISEHLSQFSTQEFSHASGHEYVQTANATMNLPAALFSDGGRSRRPGLYILLLVALAAGGVIWWNNRDNGITAGSGGAESEAASTAVAAETDSAKGGAAPVVAPPSDTTSVAAPATVTNTSPPPAEEPAIPPAVPAATDPVPATPVTPPEAPAKPPKAVVVDEAKSPPPSPKQEN